MDTEGWRGDVGTAKSFGHLETASCLGETGSAAIIFRHGPLGKADQVDDGEVALFGSGTNLIECATSCDPVVKFLDPRLDAIPAGIGSRVDHVQNRGPLAADGAGIETIGKGHRCFLF